VSIDYCVICDECGIVLAASRKNAKQARDLAAISEFRAVCRSPQDFCRECHEGRVRDAHYDRMISAADERRLNLAKLGGDS
jgi:hypothetical protein